VAVAPVVLMVLVVPGVLKVLVQRVHRVPEVLVHR
jgi:hypothetical protein